MGQFKYCKKCLTITQHKIIEASIIRNKRKIKKQCLFCKKITTS